ncbi:hypothetical protein ACFL0L_01625 [Patescibacteria group bacterium]
MKKALIFSFIFGLGALVATPVVAMGMPAAHGVDGKTFGMMVSSLEPGVISEHVSNMGGNGMGMPAAHGVDGMTFGDLVSDLAQMYPGAVSEHVK